MGCDACFQPGYEQGNSLDETKEFEKVNPLEEEVEENGEANETKIILEKKFGKEFEKEKYLNYPPKKPNKQKKKNSPEESSILWSRSNGRRVPGLFIKVSRSRKAR